MNNTIKSVLTYTITAAALVLSTISAQAATYSKSRELVVMEPRDLPEQAQVQGNALLLHSDNKGNTYLYVEQQRGGRLSVFDVTDPSHIKVVVSAQIPNEGPFDFVRPLANNAELVYFRDGQKTGVLDLRKVRKPVLRITATLTDLATAEQLGRSGLLAATNSYSYVPAVARDFQVIDISSKNPTPLVTAKEVKHRVTNDETGTTFLLGSDGLTVVRRLNVENEYKMQQIQMQHN
jgi:hypothetical protein